MSLRTVWEMLRLLGRNSNGRTRPFPLFLSQWSRALAGIVCFGALLLSGTATAASFSDDFSTDTLGEYGFVTYWASGGTGQASWDSAGQRLRILTGDNVGLRMSRTLPSSVTGRLELQFLGTQKFPAGGAVTVRLSQDANNYYELTNWDGYGPGYIRKVVNGTGVGIASLASEYAQNRTYNMALVFSPSGFAVEGFGGALSIAGDSTSLVINNLEIELSQQHGYLDNLFFTTDLTQAPVADAGSGQSVVGGATVTLDGGGSSDLDGSVTGYAWSQVGGTPVILSDAGAVQPTFISPVVAAPEQLVFELVVTDNDGLLSAADQVAITVLPEGGPESFSDDFSTDTLGEYGFVTYWASGGTGQASWDSAGQRLRILTGDNVGLRMSRTLPSSVTGRLELQFLGTQKFPAGGAVTVRLSQDANNYYELTNWDGYGPGYIRKVVNGTGVGIASLASEYAQNRTYNMALVFSPSGFAVEGFGGALSIAGDSTSLVINNLEIELSQQHGYLDNLFFTTDLTQAPVADAGSGQSVVGGATVTLDGGGSSDLDGSVTGYAWSQVGGTPVILSDAGAVQPTFISPVVAAPEQLVFELVVTDNDGLLSAADQVAITVLPAGQLSTFDDSFSSNTVGNYTIENTWTSGGTPQVSWDSAGQRLRILTGDNVGVEISAPLPATASGVFELDFLPVKKYPAGGQFELRLIQDAQNYYQFWNSDGYGPGYVRIVINGAVAAESALNKAFFQGTNFDLNVSFDSNSITVGGLVDVAVASAGRSLLVSSFSLSLSQQDAYIDNISFEPNDVNYYVAIGDSITEGFADDLPGDGIGYAPVLEDLLNGAVVTRNLVFNEGVSGDRADDGLSKLPSILARHPAADLYLVQFGTNDVFLPFTSGVGLSQGQPGYAGSYKDQMQQIINLIVAAGKDVALAKVPPLQAPYDDRNALLMEYNQVIDELVLANGISLIPPDFFCYFSANPSQLVDRIHPGGAGYAGMAGIWRNSIRQQSGSCAP